LYFLLKDILQPEKRGVESGINRTVSTSHTVAGVFYVFFIGPSLFPFQPLGAKKGDVYFDVDRATKKSAARSNL
jgi:hypothetical protein